MKDTGDSEDIYVVGDIILKSILKDGVEICRKDICLRKGGEGGHWPVHKILRISGLPKALSASQDGLYTMD